CAPGTALLTNQTGIFNGDPYINVSNTNLAPGQSAAVVLQFSSPTAGALGGSVILFDVVVYSGVFPPGPLTLACPDSAAVVGNFYSSPLSGGGGVLAYTYSTIGSLPGGLTLNAATGLISGTPTTAGSVNFTGMISDSAGRVAETATQSCSIFVSANNKPVATPTSLTLFEDAGATPVTVTGTDVETA